MSLTMNRFGGGGSIKNTDAILVVTVLHGATVTAAKSGKTLTPTLWTIADDNSMDCALFSIKSSLFDSQNAWTVTSVLGAQTVTGTVAIDAAEQYELFLADTVDMLKEDTFMTSWTGLSNTIGDKFQNDSNRYLVRSSDEPVLLLNYNPSGSSVGFGIISLQPTLSETHVQYGEVYRRGPYFSPDGVQYFIYYQWATLTPSSVTYIVDDETHYILNRTSTPYITQDGAGISCTDSALLLQFWGFLKRLDGLPR